MSSVFCICSWTSLNLFCVEKTLSSFDGDISTAENVTRKLCSSRMLFYTPGKELTCNGQQSKQLQWILFTVFKQPFSWDFPIRRQRQTQYNRCLIHCYFQKRNYSKIVYSEHNWTQVHVLSSLKLSILWKERPIAGSNGRPTVLSS